MIAINFEYLSPFYPYHPEELELKIHQASHVRYFEVFLNFVEYGETKPEIMKAHVMNEV
ncbi:DUF3900 domain-containing protein [Peribacillus glennii]|uniref:DUF3900 domain-containing protein n=1 Tax=Peribacillus glennii TaxID=2303991 RepID=A0A372L6V8_9BACI|nr:DUF3900 domain-containing protein [Peribacillus glennii]